MAVCESGGPEVGCLHCQQVEDLKTLAEILTRLEETQSLSLNYTYVHVNGLGKVFYTMTTKGWAVELF